MFSISGLNAADHIYADYYSRYLYLLRSKKSIMKVLKFNFSHPFKGKASLIRLNSVPLQKQIILIDNDGDLEIPIGTCQKGQWKVMLEWLYEDRSFYYQDNFEV